MYMSVKQAAEKRGISDRRVPVRIMGAKHELDSMEKLFAGYVDTRLDSYQAMLKE